MTSEERIVFESLARSTKTEYRVRVKARIVLVAADGAATRGIAREVGCAIRMTHASWLNQVEIWFSILAGKSLKGASFQAVEDPYRRLHQRLQ